MGEMGQVRERISTISYKPGLPGTGDLEPGTKLITATAEALGLGAADYSASLTLPKPADAKLVVKRICARINIQGTVLGTPNLRCRVYVDSQDADHRLFDSTIGTSTNYLEATDCFPAYDTFAPVKEVVFNALSDGVAHTFYFFLWDPNYVATVNEYTVSLVQLWESVGTKETSAQDGQGVPVLSVEHTGWVVISAFTPRLGTGQQYVGLSAEDAYIESTIVPLTAGSRLNGRDTLTLASNRVWVMMRGTVATDINRLSTARVTYRSER